MKRATRGFSIVEVLIALAVTGIVIGVAVPSVISSLQNNETAKRRSQAYAIAETWMERYRSGKETIFPAFAMGGPCAGAATNYSCTYDINHNYASDTNIPSHTNDAASLNAQMQNFKTVIQVQLVSTGGNSQLWQIQALTTYNFAGAHTVEVDSRVAQ